MSINFNDPRNRGVFYNLQSDSFSKEEYEQGVKILVRDILQYFEDDCSFVMRTGKGADAVFDIKMSNGRKPKQISLSELKSPSSMFGMFSMPDSDPKSEQVISEWRFNTYLQLLKSLKIQYPSGPSSIFNNVNSILDKIKDGVTDKKENGSQSHDKTDISDDVDKSDLISNSTRIIPYVPKPRMNILGDPNGFHIAELFFPTVEMTPDYNPGPENGDSSSEDTEDTAREVFDRAKHEDFCVASHKAFEYHTSYGFTDSIEFKLEDPVLKSICAKIIKQDGCQSLDEKKVVMQLLDDLKRHLEENPIEVFRDGKQTPLEIEDICTISQNRKEYWFVTFVRTRDIEAVLMIHKPDVIYIAGETEGLKIN